MSEAKFTEIFSRLNEAEQLDACAACIEAYRDSANPEGKKEINKLYNLFYKYNFPRVQKRELKAKTPEELAVLVKPYIAEHDAFSVVTSDALRSWLLVCKAELLADFIEGCGLTHEDGYIQETDPPSVEILSKGLEAIKGKHDEREISIYFDFLLMLQDPFWESLEEALKG